MPDTALAPAAAAPAPERQSFKLDDVMLARDVGATLWHDQKITEREQLQRDREEEGSACAMRTQAASRETGMGTFHNRFSGR